MMIKKIKQ